MMRHQFVALFCAQGSPKCEKTLFVYFSDVARDGADRLDELSFVVLALLVFLVGRGFSDDVVDIRFFIRIESLLIDLRDLRVEQ